VSAKKVYCTLYPYSNPNPHADRNPDTLPATAADLPLLR
jgi:hypothetical protein